MKMARKTKAQDKVKETPIVFFLRIPQLIEAIEPVSEQQNYSDILDITENNDNRIFNNDILKPILENARTEQYPRNTACFWCCHEFSSHQFPLPISYDTYQNIFICKGNFCSPECGLAYLYADFSVSDSTRWNRHALLNHMYASLYKEGISPAPPRSLLRLFGGQLDIKQFRNYISSTNDIIHENFHPIRMVFPTMAIQGPLRDIKRIVALSSEVIERASESLRLKRSKPVNLNIPTLDLCIKH